MYVIICMYMYYHTDIRSQLHTHMYACVRAYLRTFMLTCMHA